jgi:DNA-binding transcriptional LysR family regulator
MPIELRLLRHAAAVAKCGSFGQAAKSLHLTQPALSRSIAHLEDVLGVKLFERGTRTVAVTAIGKVLLERGERLLQDATELVQEIKSSQGLGIGELRVGAALYPEAMSAGKAVARLIGTYPKLYVHLAVGDFRGVLQSLLRGEIDLAFIEVSPAEADPRVDVEIVGRHTGTFFCSADHPLAKVAVPTLEQVVSYPLACGRIVERAAKFLTGLNLQGKFDPENGDFLPALRIDSVSAVKQAVVSGGAVAWAPLNLIRDEIAAGKLHAIPLELPWAQLNYGFVTLRGRSLSLSALAFMEEVRKIEGEIVKAEQDRARTPTVRRRVSKRAAKRKFVRAYGQYPRT